MYQAERERHVGEGPTVINSLRGKHTERGEPEDVKARSGAGDPAPALSDSAWKVMMKNLTVQVDTGRGEERVRCMERVTWNLILPYVK